MLKKGLVCMVLLAFADAAALAAPSETAQPPVTGTRAGVRTTIFGDVILSYVDIENNQVTNLDAESFRVDQADLGLHHQIGDWVVGYARIAMSPSSFSLSEAYVKFEGLPWDGAVTLGKFYRPMGAAIPLSNLTFPQLMLDAYPEVGVKLNFLKDPISFELGVMNGNTLAAPASSARVGGTSVLSNANSPALEVDNNKNYYGRIAVNTGEDWGSLTAGMTYLAGHLMPLEIDGLNPGGAVNLSLFRTTDLQDFRQHVSWDLDYQTGPWRLFGQYVRARDGRLRRDLYSAAGSHTIYPRCGAITATLGYDYVDIKEQEIRIQNPVSWDRERTSFTIGWWPYESILVQMEFDRNSENVRQTGGGKLPNDAFTLQTVFYF